jgi:DNA-binding LacI/PurR family transcriptional regulator
VSETSRHDGSSKDGVTAATTRGGDLPGAPGTKKLATMADVARVAGVSHMTVSRALNHPDSVTSKTLNRVLAAVEQLGYRRNVAARTLVTGRSQMVGIAALNSVLHGPTSSLYAVVQAAREKGYFVNVASVDSIDSASVRHALTKLRDEGADGIIAILPLANADEALADVAKDLPIVAVEAGSTAAVPAISLDQVEAARLATSHLLELGHRSVWHIAGPDTWLEATARATGWRLALEAARAEVPPLLAGDWTPQSGYEAGRVLASMPQATAVFAANDDMALGAMYALSESGRGVPSDVSVVGFDDVPGAAFFRPPLTTIRRDFALVGRTSVSMLKGLITDRDATCEPILLSGELVVRRSTAAPSD